MKALAALIVLGLAAHAGSACAGVEETPKLTGPYLGQAAPGRTPKVFAPGFVSTGDHEFSCTFSPDGKEFYFARGTGPNNGKAIMVTRLVDGIWTAPARAFPSFENEHFEPHITPDGKTMYFMGFNPVAGKPRPDIDLFRVERTDTGWGTVQHMGQPFNPAGCMFATTTRGGAIYTTDAKAGDIVRSVPAQGGYRPFENLGAPINTEAFEAYPFIAPDESYLLYNVMSQTSGGLMVSFRGEDGKWSAPKKVELGMMGGSPSVSPDGKYLFFVSGRPGEIYWVDMEIVRSLKP
jgi:Tol biopolymer transport system component